MIFLTAVRECAARLTDIARRIRTKPFIKFVRLNIRWEWSCPFTAVCILIDLLNCFLFQNWCWGTTTTTLSSYNVMLSVIRLLLTTINISTTTHNIMRGTRFRRTPCTLFIHFLNEIKYYLFHDRYFPSIIVSI